MGEVWDLDLQHCWKSRLGSTFVENIGQLYKDKELVDYLIHVEDKQYYVHKFVMAVYSDFFRTMFRNQFKSSEGSSVTLFEPVTKAGFEPVLRFIYEDNILDVDKGNIVAVLSCSSMLQIPLISDMCIENLSDWIDIDTCIDILNLTLLYNLKSKDIDLLAESLDSIITHFDTLVERPEFLELSVDSLKLVLASEKLDISEIYRLQLIQKWIDSDESRVKDATVLLETIRFCLINPEILPKLADSLPFLKDTPTFQKALDEAISWHQLPIKDRVLMDTVNSGVRSPPCVLALGGDIYSENPEKNPNETMYALRVDDFESDELISEWEPVADYTPPRTPILRNCSAAVVNNYLILCGGFKNVKDHVATSACHILDPRTMQWGVICSMNVARAHAAIAVHNNQILVFGGENKGHFTNIVERYDFKNDRWESLERLQKGISRAAACTFDNLIYIIGGHFKAGRIIKNSRSVHVFDPNTLNWTYNPELNVALHGHSALVMSDLNSCTPRSYLTSRCIKVVPRSSNFIHSYFPINGKWCKHRLNEEPPGDASIVEHDERIYYINGWVTSRENGYKERHYHACAVYCSKTTGFFRLKFLDVFREEVEGLLTCTLSVNSHANETLDHVN